MLLRQSVATPQKTNGWHGLLVAHVSLHNETRVTSNPCHTKNLHWITVIARSEATKQSLPISIEIASSRQVGIRNDNNNTQENTMTFRSTLFTIIALLLSTTLTSAQDVPAMIIHTTDGESQTIRLENIEQITFDEVPEIPDAGDERDFPLTDDMDITMVWIPSGNFMMGAQDNEQDAQDDEYPRHRVTLDYGFWMGKYEVTQAQWEDVMGNNPSHFDGANRPVEQVSWNDIQGFESELNDAFRLPSEAEWEYACRAGTTARYFWGDNANQIGNYAWYSGNSNGQSHGVGDKEPNAWNLHDVNGNVWEWCEDVYHDNYNGAPDDGSAWIQGGNGFRVFRGGGWGYPSENCRSASRAPDRQGSRSSSLGFRLVRDAD